MPRDLDLKRRLELAGLTVTEIDGWTTRGADSFAPKGSVNHHTGGSIKGPQPSLGVVINGRSDLPGPLCNVHGPREDTLRVNLVAAGKANHAGAGGWKTLSGNSSVWGLEEEHTGGAGEPLSEVRLDRMARVHAAFLFGTAEAEMCCQHREWAPGRKPDFTSAWVHPDDFRRRVAERLRLMALPPAPDSKAGVMFIVRVTFGPDKDKVFLCGNGKEVKLDIERQWKELEPALGPVHPVSDVTWDAIRSTGRPRG